MFSYNAFLKNKKCINSINKCKNNTFLSKKLY